MVPKLQNHIKIGRCTLAPTDSFVAWNPACLKIYIDDITMRCTAPKDDKVLDTLLDATACMKSVVENELLCSIAVGKAAV
jgi:hypothetical protein